MRGALDVERSRSAALEQRVAQVEDESASLRAQLAETLKLVELQQADLDRYKKAYEAAQPNHPERVPREQLQLAFERVLEWLADAEAANDARTDGDAAADALAGVQQPAGGEGGDAPCAAPPEHREPKRRRGHGRRRLDLTRLPVERIVIDPPEVTAAGGEGFRYMGDETSERVARRRAGYLRLRIVRRKFARMEPEEGKKAAVETAAAAAHAASSAITEPAAVLVAPLPDSVWPKVMADPSAIADVIVSKYSDCLPLNRQETISAREGFAVPRSTQSGWLKAALPVCAPVVEAMFAEGRREAFCIATDSTSVSVRAKGKRECESWHVFVFTADRDHVVFRYSQRNTSVAVSEMLQGFRGHLLADAAATYDAVFRAGDVVEVACWMHQRRYVYRALETDRDRALEGLAIIGKLFEIDRSCRALGLDLEAFGAARAQQARPMLELFDRWVARHRGAVDPRGPLDKAIGYYDNQRAALHRFLEDGRLRLDNGVSERALRNVVLGEHNWTFFANETGLRWYTTYRSLIASCILHRINPELYMEELLRLAPHWPKPRVLELAPKYYLHTREHLDERHRAIITRPWESTPAPAADLLVAPAGDAPDQATPA
ncbi:MAG: IS66 family transposase, partial [Gemmatimonadaceae bacterium]